MRIVRGATCVEENSIEEITRKTEELFGEIIRKNNLSNSDILGIIFTMTNDLTKIFPSRIVRERFGLSHTPLLDLEHKFVEGAMDKCIRVMVFVDTDKDLEPVYLHRAKSLREDISGGGK